MEAAKAAEEKEEEVMVVEGWAEVVKVEVVKAEAVKEEVMVVVI